MLIGFNLWLGLACLGTWALMALLVRISSLSALATAFLAPVYAGLLMGWGNAAIVVLVIALLLIYRHKSNILKLLAGQEARIGKKS